MENLWAGRRGPVTDLSCIVWEFMPVSHITEIFNCMDGQFLLVCLVYYQANQDTCQSEHNKKSSKSKAEESFHSRNNLFGLLHVRIKAKAILGIAAPKELKAVEISWNHPTVFQCTRMHNFPVVFGACRANPTASRNRKPLLASKRLSSS